MTAVAVSDTGPLIHLAELDSLELLSAFDRVFVPETVYRELEQGGVPDELSTLSFERVEPENEHSPTGDLDPGERAALAVARERDAVLLTDDRLARETAIETGIDVHGSIGVIVRAYARERIDRDEAASLMRALQRETSLFVTDAVVERGIQLLDRK